MQINGRSLASGKWFSTRKFTFAFYWQKWLKAIYKSVD
jgi:hypothetical protein